jgi:hypothetical protein
MKFMPRFDVHGSRTQTNPSPIRGLFLGGLLALALVPALRAQTLFVANSGGGNTIYSLPTTGGSPTDTGHFNAAASLAVSGGYLWYQQDANAGLYRVPVTGGTPELMFTLGSFGYHASVGNLAVDATAGYVFYSAGTSIIRTGLNGSNPITLPISTTSVRSLSVDPFSQKLFFTGDGNSNDLVQRINYDGTGEATLYAGSNVMAPYAVLADPAQQLVYWSFSDTAFSSTTGGIARVSYDGTTTVSLIHTFAGDYATGLAVNNPAGELFWLTGNSSELYKADLLGVGPTLLADFTGVNGALGFSATAIPEPSTYAMILGAAGLAVAGVRRRLRREA